MATLLTASSCLLLRNCTKRIKQDFLDTAFNRKPSLTTYAIFCKYWLLRLKKIWKKINNIYYRRPRGPQKRGVPKGAGPLKARGRSNCYICYYCQSGTGWRIFQIWRLFWMFPRATENTLVGHMWPAASICPPLLYSTVHRGMIAKDWSEWRWTFSFSCVENWLLLRSLECVEQNVWIHFAENTRPVWFSINMHWECGHKTSPLPFRYCHCDCFCSWHRGNW